MVEPEILFESGPILVVNKPGGLLTQAPAGIDSLEAQVRRMIQRREGSNPKCYLAVLHRLDRPVCGALLLARNVRIANKLSQQFERREVTKRYWAIVEGGPHAESGRWVDFLRKVPGEARSEIVASDHSDAQYASLQYRVLRRVAGRSLLEIQLETGRTHQIRIQAGHRGWPILGDELYGSKQPFGPQTDDLRLRWIALWARELAFNDPRTHERIEILAPPPACWLAEFLPA
jgi:RluA family pseudouridine synthase